jgi:tRNA (mo5U34)-methyltransferase
MAKDKPKYRMHIEYPDGTVHRGKKDFRTWTDFIGISNVNFTGKNVLDIATDEGWWAFWSEMQGAKYVEASDVERFEDYDWGYNIDWEFCNKHNPLRGGREVFNFHHKNLNSKVVVKKESIYQATGTFDWVFAHGLMYHLRHPLLAIDNVRKLCKGVFIFETMVDIRNPNPYCAETKFYRTTELGPISNWTGATTACYNSWLKDAGFDDIYFTQPGAGPLGTPRQLFIGVADTQYNHLFQNNSNLTYCDNNYWDKVYEETKF